jgi:hypothetical protein
MKAVVAVNQPPRWMEETLLDIKARVERAD